MNARTVIFLHSYQGDTGYLPSSYPLLDTFSGWTKNISLYVHRVASTQGTYNDVEALAIAGDVSMGDGACLSSSSRLLRSPSQNSLTIIGTSACGIRSCVKY
ncbi:hypothetical protein V2G26_018278 [Clonostachys chloroleuca]